MALTDQEKLEIAAAFAAASRTNDPGALAALSAPGAVTWHNYDELEVPTEQTARALAWIHRTVPDAAWVDVAVKATTDGFLWQSILTGTAPGGPLRCHSCVVVTLDTDGRITRTGGPELALELEREGYRELAA